MPKRTDLKRILVIGSGPIVIGQAAEFDYAGTQACLALKEEGCEVILCNSNPATIMTDTSVADKVYMEPLTLEYTAKIIRYERPDAILPGIGGQTGLNLAMQLEKKGILAECHVELLGTDSRSIEQAEDREKFRELCEELGEPVLPSRTASSVSEGLDAAAAIGYPVVLRPAFTLGGTGGGFADDPEQFVPLMKNALECSPVKQVLVEKSVRGFKEIEYEVIRDRNDTAITVCNMENVDPVGIHTGDSVVVCPSQTLTNKEYHMLRDSALKVIRALGIEGALMNILEEVSTQYYHSYYDVRDTATEGFQKTTRNFVYDIEEMPYKNYIKFLYEGLHTFFVEDVKEKQFLIFAECGRKMDPKDALTLLAYQYYDFVDWRYDRTIAYDAAKQWLARYHKEYPEETRWNEKSSFIEIIPYLIEDCDKSKLPKFHIGELDTEEEIDMILDLLECYDKETVEAICWGLNEKFWAEKRRICFILIKVLVMDDGTIDTSERGIFFAYNIAEAAMQDWTLSNRERLLCYIIRTVPRYEPFCNEMVRAVGSSDPLIDDLRFKEFVYMPSGFQRKQYFNVGDEVQYIFYDGNTATLRKSSIAQLSSESTPGILMSEGYKVPERYVFPL